MITPAVPLARCLPFACLFLVACAEPFGANEACDMATTYISNNHVWVTTAESYFGAEVQGCTAFWSREDDGVAGNSVQVGYEPDDGALYTSSMVDCSFYEADQGWFVQQCTPQF